MTEMENMAQTRLMQFIKTRGLTIAAFERKCGLSNGYVKNMKKGIGSNKVEDILRAFPELNRVWLVTGEGEMIKPIDSSVNVQFGDITGFKQSGTGNTAFSPGASVGDMSEVQHLRREIVALNAQIARLEKELDGKQAIIEALLNK